MKAIRELEVLESEVKTWLAQDGGLTMSAQDVLADIIIIGNIIQQGDVKHAEIWLGDDTPTNQAENILAGWVVDQYISRYCD